MNYDNSKKPGNMKRKNFLGAESLDKELYVSGLSWPCACGKIPWTTTT